MADRNLRRCIDFQLISNTLHTVISGLSLAGLGFVLSLHFSSLALTSKWKVLFYGSLTVILFVHGLWIDTSILETQERGFTSDEQAEDTLLMKLLLNISTRSARIRTGYIVAIGIKLFLGLIGVFISARKEKIQILLIYQHLIISPVLPLSQIFFNTFGFYRQLWLVGELFSPNRLAMIKKPDSIHQLCFGV